MSRSKMRVAIDCDDAATELKKVTYEALQKKSLEQQSFHEGR